MSEQHARLQDTLCAPSHIPHNPQALGHKIDFDHWHKSCHYGHVDYEALIQPDPQLREMLLSIDMPKYVFTNADQRHAAICLHHLGIEDCFLVSFLAGCGQWRCGFRRGTASSPRGAHTAPTIRACASTLIPASLGAFNKDTTANTTA